MTNTDIGVTSLDDRGDADLVTLSEAAGILRVPVNTLRYWRQLGHGPRFFQIGRHLVTTAGDLKTWIQEQKNGPQPGAA